VVQVNEPSEEKAILMVRGVASILEKHHRVQVLDEALEAAVRLSHRYIPARQLPDKAVSLLDTSCARVAISQHAVPPQLEDCRRRIEALEVELEIIGREEAVGIDVAERRRRRRRKLRPPRRGAASSRRAGRPSGRSSTGFCELARSFAGHETSKGQAASSRQPARREGRGRSGRSGDAEERQAFSTELTGLQRKLTGLQGEAPLILPSVDEHAIASVVQDWTGVPVGRMVKNEIEAVLNLADTLNQRVIGQRHASR
jgi:type VI secretion system protein VasG